MGNFDALRREVLFYERHIRNKSNTVRVSPPLVKENPAENVPLIIRDLLVCPQKQSSSYSYGESSIQDPNKSTKQGLLDHIHSLINITRLYHEQAYGEYMEEEKKYHIKPEYDNTITRLSLYEFSLYGKEPLDLDTFANLVEQIHVLAQQLYDNVHLLLSSFSVLDRNKKLLNVAVYIQGGKKARLNFITKLWISDTDPSYLNMSYCSLRDAEADPDHALCLIAGKVVNLSPLSSENLFEVETKGGIKYLQIIEICLDHIRQRAKLLLCKKLREGAQFPDRVDQILSSNTTHITEKGKITPSLVQVDPWVSHYFLFDEQLVPDDFSLTCLQLNAYPNMQLVSSPGRLRVTKPPFGWDYCVEIFQERRLKGYTQEIQLLKRSLQEKTPAPSLLPKEAKFLILSFQYLKLFAFLFALCGIWSFANNSRESARPRL